METIRHPLSKLRNTYPEPDVPVSKSYLYDNGAIKYSGVYPNNFIKFQIVSLDDIKLGALNLDETITFKFIVRFMFTDGTTDDWTSSNFLKELQQAQQDNNPFFSRDRITVAEINYEQIVDYCNSEKFIVGEDYAEVKITKTIGIHIGDNVTDSKVVKEDILRHINWIVNSDDELRKEEDYGAWVLETNQHNLGFSTNPFAKVPESSNIEENTVPAIPENITPTIVKPTSTNNIQTINQSFASAPPPPKSTYPFQTGGNYTGEVRINISTGVSYEWTNGKWIISKYVI
jgi:hypothetical protein